MADYAGSQETAWPLPLRIVFLLLLGSKRRDPKARLYIGLTAHKGWRTRDRMTNLPFVLFLRSGE
jgi:hypothetical protein